MTGSTGALLIEDCDSPGHEGHLRNHRGNRSSERLGKVQGPSSRDCLSGERSGRNRENWSSDKWSGNSDARKDRGQSLNDPYVNDDRGHGNRGRFHGDRGQQESESNQGQYGLERNRYGFKKIENFSSFVKLYISDPLKLKLAVDDNIRIHAN